MEQRSTRIRRRNNGLRKVLLMLILFIFVLLAFFKLLIPGAVTVSRYIYSIVRSYYLESKSFYFNSDKLNSMGTAYFESDNWSGNIVYGIDITTTSKKNLTKYSDYNLNYFVDYEYKLYDNNDNELVADNYFDVIMSANTTGGTTRIARTIQSVVVSPSANNSDTFTISIDPTVAGKQNLLDGYYIVLEVKAYTEEPYKEALTGTYKVIVGTPGLSYQIEDKENDLYMNLIVTNSKDSYIVETPFTYNGTSYAANDTIPALTYLNMISDDPSIEGKCYSMRVGLSFDPSIIVLDSASREFITARDKGRNLVFAKYYRWCYL